MDRMTVRIEAGNSPFTNMKEAVRAGIAVVELDGMGQKHYYFRVGPDLYWLAIEPARALVGLDELLAGATKDGAR
jgi:hypothetical protein